VRCCSDTEIERWNQRTDIGCTVWTEADVWDEGCQELNYHDAAGLCHAQGARLCSLSEIEDNCTSGTGCSYGSRLIWAADSCTQSPSKTPTIVPTISPTVYVSKAYLSSSNPDSCNSQDCETRCSLTSEVHPVRCCSDTEIERWNQRTDIGCTVWTEADVWDEGCQELNYHDAAGLCHAQGARLCTLAEIEDNCTSGTGCSYGSRLIWAADACEE